MDFRLADAFEGMDSPERLAEEYQEYLKRQIQAQQEKEREIQAREEELAQMYL